ncbi:MAG: 16S rRNA (guanine(966)-N(2))-methyltransferase RsmD [bacterium]
MIRIISGRHRGRRLQVPEGRGVRPTTDRVREALFSMLDHALQWQDKWVLDLFSGSGALGLEALSRGARKAWLVEASRKHASVLKRNLEALRLEACEAQLVHARAEAWLPKFRNPEHHICVIFCDPPYESELYERLLPQVASSEEIPGGSWVVVESPETKAFKFPSSLILRREKRYGSIRLQLLEKLRETSPDGEGVVPEDA